MRKVFLVLAGLLISCFNLYSQVQIKEKVEIQPSANKSLSSTSAATTGTFTITLGGGPSSATIGSQHFSGQSGLSATVENFTGYYSYHVSSAKMVDGVKWPGPYSIQATFSGYVILDLSGSGYDAFGSGYALCDDPSLTFLRNIDTDEDGNLVVITDHNLCEGGQLWTEETGGTVTETINSQNGEFVNTETKELVGRTVSYNYGDNSYIIASKLPFDAEPEQTTVTKSYNNITRSFPYELVPQSQFIAREKIISYTDIASFDLYPYHEFMRYLKTNMRIVSGGEYASFLNSDRYEIAGDEVEVYPERSVNHYLVIENQPDDSVNVIVEFETTGNIQRDTIIIMPYLQVAVEPAIIAPGDTADIILKTWNSYERHYETMPSWYIYELGITENCGNGEILLSDERKGEFFTELTEVTAKFVTDSVDSDSINVKIKAGILQGGGGASKAVTSLKGQKSELQMGKADSVEIFKEKVRTALSNIKRKKTIANITSCSLANFTAELTTDTEVLIGRGYGLEIIEPQPNTIAWITPEPKMPEVVCKARLKGYAGEVTFMWEYEVSYNYQRWFLSKNPICGRKSKSTFYGRKEEVTFGDITSDWLVPFTNENATFEFVANNFRGNGCENIISNWTEGSNVFTGGNVKVTLTAMSPSGRLVARTELSGLKLLGRNPDTQTILEYAVSKEIKAILIHEAKSAHFTGDEIDSKFWRPYYEKGYPIYGPPNGYGLMQLDNPAPTEKELWNWKSNLDGGKQLYFNEKKPMAINYLNQHKDWLDARPELKEEYYLKCAFQKYNGGVDKNGKPTYYWKWKNEGSGGWKKNDELQGDYGGAVYKIYKSLN